VVTPGSVKSDKRSVALICLLILIVAFAIRLPGIGWGLKNDLHNQSYHPDEPLIFDFVHRSNLFHPVTQREYYNYGTLYYAVLRTSESLGVVFGGVPRPSSFELSEVRSSPQAWDDLNSYVAQTHLWGRLAGALLGAATSVLIFLILCRWTTLLGALAGAALIALAPAHVEHSRFQTVDVTALFFLALATLAAVRLLRSELVEPKQWMIEVALAAALAGCAASTRYSNGLVALAVGVALLVRRPKNWPLIALSIPVTSLVAFALTTPGVVTDWNYFLANFRYQAEHANTGHGLVFVGRPHGTIFHIYQLVVGISGPAAIVGLAGLVYAAIRKHAWAWVLLAFFVPYYISIGIMQTMFLRYGFPLYIGVACGFGYAVSAIQRRTNNRWASVGVAALCLSGIENSQAGIRGTALFTQWMIGTDPRDEAGIYVKELCQQVPDLDIGTPGFSPWYWSAAIIKDAGYVYFLPNDVKREYFAQTRNPRVIGFSFGQIPRYATYSSYEVEDGQRLKDRTDLELTQLEGVRANAGMYASIQRIFQPLKTFGEGGPAVHDLEYIRPAITVLKRRDQP
jgi:hypothetical protein